MACMFIQTLGLLMCAAPLAFWLNANRAYRCVGMALLTETLQASTEKHHEAHTLSCLPPCGVWSVSVLT